MYGAEKLQGMLRHHIALGQWFAQQVAADDRFELAAPPRFGLTCFRLAGGNNEANKRLVETVNATGARGAWRPLAGRLAAACAVRR